MANLEISDKTRLKRIANNQRQMLICIVLLILFAIAGAYDRAAGDDSIFNHELYDIPAIGYGVVNFAAFIFVILLAANVYNSTIVGVINGLLCLIPCVGIIVLLIINQRATRSLRANGIKVGFMGAKMDQFS
jgi:hypothetical protein